MPRSPGGYVLIARRGAREQDMMTCLVFLGGANGGAVSYAAAQGLRVDGAMVSA